MGPSLRRTLMLITLIATAAGAQIKQESYEEGFAKTSDGISIHYLQSGDLKSPQTLVLIPGWRCPAFVWTGQLKKFASSARVIAIDPRSQGESTKIADGNTPEQRAQDYHDVLSKLGVAQPVLVGWSQGVQDVSAYLQQFGDGSVAGVVIVDGVVSSGPTEVESRKENSKQTISGIVLYARIPKEYSEGMARAIFKKPLPDQEFQRVVHALLQTPTDTGIAMLVEDFFGADRRPALAKLNKPALVIASAASRELAEQREMAADSRGQIHCN